MLIELVRGDADGSDERPEHSDEASDIDPFTGVRELRVESLSLPDDGDPGSSTLASILVSRVRDVAAAAGAGEPQDKPAGRSLERTAMPTLRIQAMRLLGTVGEPGSDAVAALIEMTESDTPELFCEALQALAAIGDRQALPAIRAALGSELTDIRLAALDAIDQLGAAADIELNQLLDDPDPIIRERTVLALGNTPGAAGASRIVQALGRRKALGLQGGALGSAGSG